MSKEDEFTSEQKKDFQELGEKQAVPEQQEE